MKQINRSILLATTLTAVTFTQQDKAYAMKFNFFDDLQQFAKDTSTQANQSGQPSVKRLATNIPTQPTPFNNNSNFVATSRFNSIISDIPTQQDLEQPKKAIEEELQEDIKDAQSAAGDCAKIDRMRTSIKKPRAANRRNETDIKRNTRTGRRKICCTISRRTICTNI